MSSWSTVREYAVAKGMATSSVYKKIKKGLLATKVVMKKTYVSQDLSLIDKQNDVVIENPDYISKNAQYNNPDIIEVRKKKIMAETEFLSQKIITKKEQMFSEWSEKFFQVFAKSFAKFKNSLIQLQLNDVQVKKLNQNLEKAIKNMELSLSEIKTDYLSENKDDEKN